MDTKALAGDTLAVGLEPSCLMTLRDEFVSFCREVSESAREPRGHVRRVDDAREESARASTDADEGACPRPSPSENLRRLRCDSRALRGTPDLTVAPIIRPVAGSQAPSAISPRRRTSGAMAEADLMPAVRNAKPEELIVARSSCRHQIAVSPGEPRRIRSACSPMRCHPDGRRRRSNRDGR